jgi:hypothetical protein
MAGLLGIVIKSGVGSSRAGESLGARWRDSSSPCRSRLLYVRAHCALEWNSVCDCSRGSNAIKGNGVSRTAVFLDSSIESPFRYVKTRGAPRVQDEHGRLLSEQKTCSYECRVLLRFVLRAIIEGDEFSTSARNRPEAPRGVAARHPSFAHLNDVTQET